jgi:hypothetical protein
MPSDAIVPNGSLTPLALLVTQGVSTPIENCMDLAAENCMPTIFIAA